MNNRLFRPGIDVLFGALRCAKARLTLVSPVQRLRAHKGQLVCVRMIIVLTNISKIKFLKYS